MSPLKVYYNKTSINKLKVAKLLILNIIIRRLVIISKSSAIRKGQKPSQHKCPRSTFFSDQSCAS